MKISLRIDQVNEKEGTRLVEGGHLELEKENSIKFYVRRHLESIKDRQNYAWESPGGKKKKAGATHRWIEAKVEGRESYFEWLGERIPPPLGRQETEGI